MQISASILAADFSCLGAEAKRAGEAGIQMLHIDVMDGLFVPNISFGAPVLKDLNRVSCQFMDVHLMIQNPIRYIEDFKNAGADGITFHVESDSDIAACIQKIRLYGLRAGLSLKPNTPLEMILPYVSELDLVLVMSVEPGFGGQKFMDSSLEKIKRLRLAYPSLSIQVDGGINEKTGALCVQAGADGLVAGSYLFGAENLKEAVSALEQNCRF